MATQRLTQPGSNHDHAGKGGAVVTVIRVAWEPERAGGVLAPTSRARVVACDARSFCVEPQLGMVQGCETSYPSILVCRSVPCKTEAHGPRDDRSLKS